VVGLDAWADGNPWDGHILGAVGAVIAIVATVVGLHNHVRVSWHSGNQLTEQGVNMFALMQVAGLHPTVGVTGRIDRAVVDEDEVVAVAFDNTNGLGVHLVVVIGGKGWFVVPAVDDVLGARQVA